MANGSRGRCRIASRSCRKTPYPLLCKHDKKKDTCPKKFPKGLDKKDWKDATCSVCMECPHNAVLLLCSSHNKGCRPYMCGTSLRYSNCLDQYRKAYTKLTPPNFGLPDFGSPLPVEKCEAAELLCPLCRGQVKGWTVVEPAREFLNSKKRNCMQEDCPFVGNYKELRKHVKAEHPSARPREVDPALERKWRRLERERERDDVISTIRSAMPRAMVFGDYVVESHNHSFNSDEDDLDADMIRGPGFGLDSYMLNVFAMVQAFWQAGSPDLSRLRQPGRSSNAGRR